MNSYRRCLRSGILFNLKLFLLEKVKLGRTWSNLVKLVKLGQTWSSVLKTRIIWCGSLQKISIVGDGPIDIYTLEGCPQINIIILIRGLGECEGVGEDSGTR